LSDETEWRDIATRCAYGEVIAAESSAALQSV